MYKLIIVDDEAAIRRGMCHYIPWNDMGFKVIADFEDGTETIEFIMNNDVDVIITDIEMAQTTGLELAEFVHINKPEIKMVILSGYKVFEYARKAVEYDVEHYLLKPINLDEVHEVFKKIKTDLDNKKTDEQLMESKQKDFEKILVELQEQFFTSILVGGFNNEQKVVEKSKFLNLDLNVSSPYALLDLKFGDMEKDDSMYSESDDEKQNLLHSMFGQKNEEIKFYVVSLSSGVIKIIAESNKTVGIDEFELMLKMQIEDKCQIVEKLLHVNFDVKIEKLFDNLGDFIKYNYNFQMRVENDSGETKLVKEDYKRLLEKYKVIHEYISDGDFESLEGHLDNIFYEFRNLPLNYVKNLVVDMFSLLSSKLMRMGNGIWEEVKEIVDYQSIMNKNSLDELKAECKSELKLVVSVINRVQNDATKCVVLNAISYIKENYNEDVSLDNLAEKYFLNSAYFSRIFKQYTGNTFTQFLTEFRIGKAKELLKTGKYKIYEISQMVGYNSEKYFFRVFKQQTGTAPAEYIRNVALENE